MDNPLLPADCWRLLIIIQNKIIIFFETDWLYYFYIFAGNIIIYEFTQLSYE